MYEHMATLPSLRNLEKQLIEDLQDFPMAMAPHLIFLYLCSAKSLGREEMLRELRKQGKLKED